MKPFLRPGHGILFMSVYPIAILFGKDHATAKKKLRSLNSLDTYYDTGLRWMP